MVQVNYYFMHNKGDSDILTMFNCVDCKSGSVGSCVCARGLEVYAVEMVVQFLMFLRRAAVVLRHDGENAIKLFAKAVANAREHDTRDECTLEYSSSSLGVGKRTASWRRRSAPCAAP